MIWIGRARTAEAMALLALTAVAQKTVPMARWSAWLGTSVPVPEPWRGRAVERHVHHPLTATEIQVLAAVTAGSRRLPWHPTCLAEAATGQVMLRRRGAPGVVVIGLRPGPGGSTWEAHAWLMGRSGVLTGRSASRGFTATGVFEVRGGLSAAELAEHDLVI